MRILYISYDGMTDPLGQSQVLPYLFKLSSLGHRILILSCEKAKRSNEIPIIAAGCKAHNVEWVTVPYQNSPPIISTVRMIRRMKAKALSLHDQHTFDIVHCRSYIPSIVGLALKREKGLKFIFDMRGFWADERFEGGIWSRSNPVYRLVYNYFKRQEKELLANADHVISLTEKGKEIINSWNVTDTPITVIPTCVDTEMFDAAKITEKEKEEWRRELKIEEGRFVLLYHGSWGTWYMATEMSRFFSVLKQQIPNAVWVIATPDKVDLTTFQHNNDIRVFSCPRSKVPLTISIASMSVFFIRPSFSKNASSPTKLGELIAMNAPVVTNAGVGDIDRILGGSKTAAVVREFSDNEYRQAIQLVLNMKNATPGADLKSYFSLTRGVGLYDEVYKTTGAKGA